MNRSSFARLAVPTGALGVSLLLTASAGHADELSTAPPTLACPDRPVEASEVVDAESFHSEHGSLQVELSFRRSLDSHGRQHYCPAHSGANIERSGEKNRRLVTEVVQSGAIPSGPWKIRAGREENWLPSLNSLCRRP